MGKEFGPDWEQREFIKGQKRGFGFSRRLSCREIAPFLGDSFERKCPLGRKFLPKKNLAGGGFFSLLPLSLGGKKSQADVGRKL